jgi:thiol-disulfide isomerase/thioredoxin
MPPITVPLHAPELASGTWIQGPEVSIAFCRGAVVLVEFWESTCVNCVRTLPYMKAWHARYAGRGLTIVGIHTPEFEFSGEAGTVAAAVAAEGIPYPVLLDRDRKSWQLFANHYWPSRYLIDARGYLRYEHFGEGAYGETEEWIQRLLQEAGDAAPMPALLEPVRAEDLPGAVCYPATREIYAGFHRGKLLAPEGYRPGEEVRHQVRTGGPAPVGMFSVEGLWFHEAEYLETREPGAVLELVCEAAGVHVVLAPGGEMETEVDGEPVRPEERGEDVIEREGRTVAAWESGRMVRLVGGGRFRRRRLTLRFRQAGVRVYAFSFTTSCVLPAPALPPRPPENH